MNSLFTNRIKTVASWALLSATLAAAPGCAGPAPAQADEQGEASAEIRTVSSTGQFTIERFEPETPIENRPMYIRFAFTNNTNQRLSGFVGATAEGPDPKTIPWRKSDIKNDWA